MNPRLYAVALGAALSACAIAPQPHFDVASAFEPEGLALSASDTIAFLVTVEPDPDEIELFGGSPANSETLGFRSGFQKAHPDVRLVMSDEALTKACFDSGTKAADPSGAVLIDPDLSAALCANLVKERAIRYLVSIGAKKLMRVVGSSSSGGVAETEAMHRFKVTARVTDTKTGAVVCSGVHWHLGLCHTSRLVRGPATVVGAYSSQGGRSAGQLLRSAARLEVKVGRVLATGGSERIAGPISFSRE